jgi:hypothetical protein
MLRCFFKTEYASFVWVVDIDCDLACSSSRLELGHLSCYGSFLRRAKDFLCIADRSEVQMLAAAWSAYTIGVQPFGPFVQQLLFRRAQNAPAPNAAQWEP